MANKSDLIIVANNIAIDVYTITSINKLIKYMLSIAKGCSIIAFEPLNIVKILSVSKPYTVPPTIKAIIPLKDTWRIIFNKLVTSLNGSLLIQQIVKSTTNAA